jgi:glycosyltransferase involved in cell wall biosynthesis
MRVLLVTHYFPPEVGAPQARLSEMARYWSAEGVDVTVLTGMPNHPSGIVHPPYRRAVLRRERGDGYRIVRTWLYATPNRGILRRTLGHLSFMVSSVLLGAWHTGRCDVVVVSSPTFFAIASAWLIARLRRARFVVEVRDLWPAIFVELGVLTNRRVIALLERFELAAYRAADAVVVVSDGFRDDLIRRGVPAEKVTTIRNGVDVVRFGPERADRIAARHRLGLVDGEVVVLYAGAHGISHGLPSIAAAAAQLAGEPIRFLFVGDGEDKPKLAEAVRRHRVESTVRLLPPVAADAMPDLLAAADVCLVPLRDLPLFATFIPSKLFEYLAAEKAVVGCLRGEAARILADAGAVVVPPEDPDALAAALRALAHDADRRREMGKQGRDYVACSFDRRALADAYRLLLARVVA